MSALERIDLGKLSIDISEKEQEFLNISDYLVNPDVEIEEPTPILSIQQGYSNISIFTEDNISLLQGRAKSRKSTLLRAICAAISSGEYQMFKSGYTRNDVAIVDTEQGAYHCWRAARNIKYLSKRTIPYYKVAGCSIQQKKFLVEEHLKRNPNCGFMVLDNIVHFLNNFNDPTESAELNQWLIKIKSDYNVHLCLVLHENGSDTGNGKAKGHLGSLLENTCESIIRIEKNPDDKGQSIVSAKAMRGLEFEPFILETDHQGTPYLSAYSPIRKGKMQL